MFSKTPSKKANRKLSKIIAGGAATDSIEGNTSEKPAKTSMKKRKSNGRSDGSAEAGAPQMMVTCIEPQSEPRKKNEKSGAVPSEELKLGAKPLKRKFKSEPMPSLRMGFAIKCKKDDQSQRFDLVVESQLANRVYIVKNSKNDRLCCLKIEPYESSNELKQLKRDVFVLLDAVKNPHYGNKHFLPIVNKGVCQEFFNYLVTPLCEGNLVDIRENVVGGDFCSETAVRLTFDTFQAITDLHGLGHVHRCVAPSKFVVGREGKGLYLVGLSFAIRHVNPSQSSPRKLEHFGPNRYQSRAWHRNKHQFRRDDLESWLFMVIEFFGVKLIPWNADMSDMEVLVQKERLFNDGFEEIFKVAPKQFELLLNFLNKMTSQDKPDYEFIACTLVTIREKIQCELKGPYDWTAQGAKKKVVSNKKLKKASKKLVGSEDEEDEPERPGKTSLHKKKAPKTQVETDEDEAQFVSKPKRKPAPSLAEEAEDDVETERSRPKQKKKKKKASVEQENDGGEEEADKSPKPKKKSKKKRVPQPEEVEDDEETVPPVKAPKKKKPVIENLTEAADVVSPKPPNKKKSKGKVSQVPSKEEDSNSDPENDQTEILAKPAKKSKKKAEKTGESTEQFPLEMDKKKPPKQQAPKPAKEPSELTPSEKQDVGLDPSDQAVPSTNSAASEAKAEAAPPSCYANP
ncbi:hypothetical protein L596_018017 [Steinernema carpocapsae]|uniref:Protein kinase domain-containing protein n=1 Tax=Steinernema carpocapsae TaxID=34508 RepID=A0A4U5N3T4_STECR|nr:hypothetical protein L596_018017 [Steinernema carpocapsae]